MASYRSQLRSLFQQIDMTPWGPQERALVAQAVALAQESGNASLEYEARMRQTASANMGGDTDLMLTSFAWCLAHHDQNPKKFPAEVDGGGDLLWQYKWMAGALRGSPAFSQEQIAAVLDDMEEHYRRAGIGQSGVLMARFEDAWAAGRMEEAADLQRQLEATPRDDYSHCDACVRSQFAGFFTETGREDDAIRLVGELIEGGFSCGEEPEHALARILLPYLHAGMLDEAKAAHLRSYRLAKGNEDNLPIVAKNIVFLAITGNEARALSLVEKHLPWLVHDGLNADAHFEGLASFALALDAVAASGHPDVPVRGSDDAALVSLFGPHDGPWAAQELAERAWTAAAAIADEFDRRNGTPAFAGQLDRFRAIASLHYDVPLSSETIVRTPVASVPQTPDERFRRAIDLSDAGSISMHDAVRAALTDASPAQRVALLGKLIGFLVAYERNDEALAELPARIAALREVGNTAQADLEERLGLLTFGASLETAIPVLTDEIAAHADAPASVRADLLATLGIAQIRTEAHADVLVSARAAADLHRAAGDPELAAGMVLLEADALMMSGEPDAALAAVSALLDDPALTAGRRARALATRARFLGVREQFTAGAADADEATRILLELGADDGTVSDGFLLAGALHEDAQDAPAAVARYRVAVDRKDATGAASTDIRYRLGRAMLAAGYAEEAVDVLDEVFRAEAEADVPPASRALTLVLLARAFEGAEQYGNALGAWEFAAQLDEEAGDVTARAFALLQFGRLLSRLGETDDAIEPLTTATDLVRGNPEEIGLFADALHTLAQAHDQRGDDPFTLLDEAVELGRANEAGWFVADVTDSRARALARRDRFAETVPVALQAADGYAAAGDVTSAAAAELLAGRALVAEERLEDAVAILTQSVEHAGEAEQLRVAASLELGDALEKLGRHGEAAAIRATLPA